jgi:hypothetical protein
MKNTALGIFAATMISAGAALAGGHGHGDWKSVEGASSVAFGSIKKNTAGEVHHFTMVDGSVSKDGEVLVGINLASIETNIDIRNTRMIEHVFKDAATAVLRGEVDMEDITALPVGDTMIADFEGTLELGPVATDIEAEMLVARLSEHRVLVTTADFIMLSTEDLGIDAGVDKLKELASLSGITRVTPVSIRMVFEH